MLTSTAIFDGIPMIRHGDRCTHIKKTLGYKDCFPYGVSKFRLTTQGKTFKIRSSYIRKIRELLNKMCLEASCQKKDFRNGKSFIRSINIIIPPNFALKQLKMLL